VGYYFNDFDSERVTAEDIYNRAGAEIEVDDSVGFHVSAGIEIFVADNTAVNLDFKYVWNEIDLDVNLSDFADEEVDLNAFVAGVGFKYYF
jgi:outer membrane protein W